MKSKTTLIPREAIWQAIDAAEIPAKKITPTTTSVYQAVGYLKELRQTKDLGPKTERAWVDLVEILGGAITNLDFSAFDEFANAWQKLEVNVETYDPKDGGRLIHKHQIKNSPRQSVTKAVALAVLYFQGWYERTPTRQEIMSFMATHEDAEVNRALDDSELCRQLKKLGWQDLIPEQ